MAYFLAYGLLGLFATEIHFSFFTFHSSLFILHFSFFTFHSSLFTFHSSLFTLYALAFFSGVKTPLYKIGRAYGTWIDDLQSSIFLEMVKDAFGLFRPFSLFSLFSLSLFSLPLAPCPLLFLAELNSHIRLFNLFKRNLSRLRKTFLILGLDLYLDRISADRCQDCFNLFVAD